MFYGHESVKHFLTQFPEKKVKVLLGGQKCVLRVAGTGYTSVGVSWPGDEDDNYYVYLTDFTLHAGDCGAVSPRASSNYNSYTAPVINEFFARLGIARIHLVYAALQAQSNWKDGQGVAGGIVRKVFTCDSTRKGKNSGYKLNHFIIELQEHPCFKECYPSGATAFKAVVIEE